VNETVDRKNGGHIRHNDRLAIQAPAEPEILAFRPEGYDVYPGCHKSDNCGAASHWARRFLSHGRTSADALILSKSKLEVNYKKEVIGLAYFDLIARIVGTAKISR
jgi:hypothetical protein